MTFTKTSCFSQILLLFCIYPFLFHACSKKAEPIRPVKQSTRSESFFKLKKPLAPQVDIIYQLLKTADEQTHFVDRMSDKKGVPIWEKISIIGRVQTLEGARMHALSSNGEPVGPIVIPLSDDDQYLSSILTGILLPGSIANLICTTNKDFSNLVSNPATPIAMAEEITALFMLTDNTCFGTRIFKNIPERIFPHANGDLKNGRKSIEFRIHNSQSTTSSRRVNLTQIVEICVDYRNTDGCTCYDKSNCDWDTGCSDGACLGYQCFQFNIGTGGNTGGSATGGEGSGAPGSSGTGGGTSTYSGAWQPFDPTLPCGGTWYNPGMCEDINGVMVDYNAPPEDFEYHITSTGSIGLAQYFKCFSNANIPDAGASYSVTISASLPNINNPAQLIGKGGHPGHAFITMVKSNGSQSVSQTFGFYPVSGVLSITTGDVASKVVDDGVSGTEHKTHASMTLSNLTANQFSKLQAVSIEVAKKDYDLDNFNCTDFALAIFNSVSPNVLIVPDWEIWPLNFGRTPNGLYKKLQAISVSNPNVSMANTYATTSHGPCN